MHDRSLAAWPRAESRRPKTGILPYRSAKCSILVCPVGERVLYHWLSVKSSKSRTETRSSWQLPTNSWARHAISITSKPKLYDLDPPDMPRCRSKEEKKSGVEKTNETGWGTRAMCSSLSFALAKGRNPVRTFHFLCPLLPRAFREGSYLYYLSPEAKDNPRRMSFRKKECYKAESEQVAL